jgi:DNA invertase Pin-like site-specific DNA recombinase
MQAAAYLRVSSKAQNHATQNAAIQRAATARGDTVAPAAVYSEKRSAKSIARPELDRLRADARAGKVKRLYVFKYDRLVRSGVRDLLNVLEDFKTCGVEVVAVADVVDLNGPAAEMILAALAFAARLEREATNDRISAARERVEAEGGKWGRPKRLDAATVAEVQRRRVRGDTLREIAVALKVPLATVAPAAREFVPQSSPPQPA